MSDYPAAITTVNHVEPVPRRIRAFLGGEKVLDTTGALYVWEWPPYPQYYVPLADVRQDLLEPEGHTQQTGRGLAELHGLRVGDLHRPRAARVLAESPISGLSGTVRFDWAAMDAWFEEDEEIIVHPRDPYTRVDTLASSRHVRFLIDGEVVADSTRPVLLFETGLPARYYVPQTDLRTELFTPTDKHTQCPYKGTARYWSANVGGTVHPDIAWSYPTPLPESIKVAGLVSFYNVRVDLEVDGVMQERPRTHFS
jgi:uncharacterized protein (DUF427 family)